MEILDIELAFASEAEAKAGQRLGLPTSVRRDAARRVKRRTAKKKASDASLMKEARAKGYAKKKPAAVAKKVTKAVKEKGLPKRVAKKIIKTSKAASAKRAHSTATKKKISASMKAHWAAKKKGKKSTGKKVKSKTSKTKGIKAKNYSKKKFAAGVKKAKSRADLRDIGKKLFGDRYAGLSPAEAKKKRAQEYADRPHWLR